MMTEQLGYVYDVFISHSPADRDWVEAELLPRLEQAGLRVAIDYRDFVVGKPLIKNIEDAVEASRRTIVVLSPEWIASEWNAFEALLIRTQDPAAARRKLLPLRIRPCDLPDGLAKLKLDVADLTAERYKEAQLKRLVRDVEDVVPVPLPSRMRDWGAWRRWLRRYRRPVRWAAVAAVFGWLAVALLAQWFPFQRRQGWQAVSPQLPHAWVLGRVGEVLLAGSSADWEGNQGAVVWRSTDHGVTWSVGAAPDEFSHPSLGTIQTAVWGFASASPPHVYAVTSDTGLWRSDDAGIRWYRVGKGALPDTLQSIAVAPDAPETLFVGAEGAGLYRSSDGGNTWARLDGADTCPASAGMSSLAAGFNAASLLATVNVIYAGTGGADMRPAPDAGLFVSGDGGRCWRKVDDGEARYSYDRLVAVPDRPGELLILLRDYYAPSEKASSYFLWYSRPDGGRIQSLWESREALMAIYVEPGSPARWYAVTDRGHARQGLLGQTGSDQPLPALTRCLVQVPCFMDLVSDSQSGPPLLLAHGRVYRLADGYWSHSIWP